VQIISRLFSGSEDRLIFSRDVNKDSAFKAKDRTKDYTFKAKARTKDLSIFNTMERTKDFCL